MFIRAARTSARAQQRGIDLCAFVAISFLGKISQNLLLFYHLPSVQVFFQVLDGGRIYIDTFSEGSVTL